MIVLEERFEGKSKRANRLVFIGLYSIAEALVMTMNGSRV